MFAERDGRLALVDDGGGFVPPGGYAEGDESAAEAVRRELLEETGLVPVSTLVGLGTFLTLKSGSPDTGHIFGCFVGPGDIVISDEHQSCAWLPAEEYLVGVRAFVDGAPDGWVKDMFVAIADGLEQWLVARTSLRLSLIHI